MTSLADSGTGTLRTCIALKSPRVCVFEVSGRIRLKNTLFVDAPDLVVAGQTAPGRVMLTNGSLKIRASNVRVEHLEVRPGDDADGTAPGERDAVTIDASARAVSNVTLRHLSLSWALDENFSTYKAATDVRVEDCIIAEGLLNSIHPEGPHSMGALIGETARRVVFRRNLFALNNDRHPRWKFNTTGAVVNNVIYGWGGSSPWNTTNVSGNGGSGAILLDVVGNVYRAAPFSPAAWAVYGESVHSGTRVYLADNLLPSKGATNLAAKNQAAAWLGAPEPYLPVSDVLSAVLSSAGSRPWARGEQDANVVNAVLDRGGSIKSSVAQAGGWPVLPALSRTLDVPPSVTAEELPGFLSSFEGASTPTPMPTPTATPTATSSPTATPTATPTPTPTATPTPRMCWLPC